MSETVREPPPDEATLDLLIKQVLEGLSPEEQRALDVLDSAQTSQQARELERMAAAVSLAGIRAAEPLPNELAARLEADAKAHFASGVGAAAAARADNVIELRAPRTAATSSTPRKPGAALGWWAAAACLVLALFGWLRTPQPAPTPVLASAPPAEPAPPAPPPALAPPTPAEERAALIADPSSLKVSFAATKDPAGTGVTGDVVWNPQKQQGYLRFTGLKPNDPHVHQYQLWIFDGDRDQRYPVDGGVFDVPADSGEVVIPVRAALPIHIAKAFAVTVEKPGGVVVSGREHLIVLGQAT
jgi:hypothetical protein